MSRTPRGLARPAAALGLTTLLLLGGGCGEPAPSSGPSAVGAWKVAELEGVSGASGVAALGDVLVIVAGGNDRSLYLVERGALTEGARLRPRAFPLQVLRDLPLEGFGRGRSDEFVAQGYRIGTLWDQPVDFQGVALKRLEARGRAPALEAIYVLERSYGVVYHGALERDAQGRVEAVRLSAAFVVPERPREGRARSDWRDSSGGLAGILSVPRAEQAEDLYVVESQGASGGEVRVDRLDRYGQWQGRFGAVLPGGAPADVGDLSWSDGRFVLLRGGGRGALHSLADPGDFSKASVGAPVPGPDVPGAGPWRGLAHLPDGSAFLVSAGSPSRLAWRGP